jgi:hypothetical protein
MINFEKSEFRMKTILSILIAIIFTFGSSAVLYAADQWVVIKDSAGKCSVRQTKGKTPKTIAGPFATKAEAEKAKGEKCPKK